MKPRINCVTCLSTIVLILLLSLLGFLIVFDDRSVSSTCSSRSLMHRFLSLGVNSSSSAAAGGGGGRKEPSASSLPIDSLSASVCSKRAVLCHRHQKDFLDSSRTGLLSALGLHSLKFLLHGMLSSLEYTCSSKNGFGTSGLGYYEVCMDSNVKPHPRDCLIYSFGISNDWSFDEAMAKYGCEVHSFDPSLGLQDHVHAPNVTFHNVGLWGSDITDDKGWNLERLSTIRKRLGHEQRIIDILKVDIEGGEWPFLRDVLYHDRTQLTTVKQLLTELHAPRFKHETVTKRDILEMITYLTDLRRMEFEIFKNFHDGNCCEVFASFMPSEIPERCCEEIALVNKRFL